MMAFLLALIFFSSPAQSRRPTDDDFDPLALPSNVSSDTHLPEAVTSSLVDISDSSANRLSRNIERKSAEKARISTNGRGQFRSDPTDGDVGQPATPDSDDGSNEVTPSTPSMAEEIKKIQEKGPSTPPKSGEIEQEIMRLQAIRKEREERLVRSEAIKRLEAQYEAEKKEENYAKCALTKQALENMRAQDKRSDERMAEMEKANALYDEKLNKLEEHKALAVAAENWVEAGEYKKAIAALKEAYQAQVSPLNEYVFTEKGCAWLRQISKEYYERQGKEDSSAQVEVCATLPTPTRFSWEYKKKIDEFESAIIPPDNLVQKGILAKDIPRVVSRGSVERTMESVDLKQQAAAQLASSDLKGIMKSYKGFVYEVAMDGNIHPLDPKQFSHGFELRLKLLVVPEIIETEARWINGQWVQGKRNTKSEEWYKKNALGVPGILKFGETKEGKRSGTWYGNQVAAYGDENRTLFEGDQRKFSFTGAATYTNAPWLQWHVGRDYAFRFEHDDKGVTAVDVTMQDFELGYVFRMDAARAVASGASDLWNIYMGVTSEQTNHEYATDKVWRTDARGFKTSADAKVKKLWWFQAKLDKGLLDKESGTIDYRCLRSGLQMYDNYTGVVGCERILQGVWEDNAHVYHILRTQVNVPFLAPTNRGHMITFQDVGPSGMPELSLKQNKARNETKGDPRYAPIPMYALWAPRYTPTGFQVT